MGLDEERRQNVNALIMRAYKTAGGANCNNNRVAKGTRDSRNVHCAYRNHAPRWDDLGQCNPSDNRMHQTAEVSIVARFLRTEVEALRIILSATR